MADAIIVYYTIIQVEQRTMHLMIYACWSAKGR